MLEIIAIIVLGLLAGGVVNALADDLPLRRRPGLPVYPDGTLRPLSAWLGVLAFATGQRCPKNPAPNAARRTSEQNTCLSWRYPLTEIGTVILMLLALNAVYRRDEIPPEQLLFLLPYMAILMLVTVIDIEHKLILFIVMIPSMAFAMLDAFVTPNPIPAPLNAFWGGVLGFGVFFILYQLGNLFTYIMRIGTTAFGYGDVMLMTLSGLMLGFGYTFLTLFITIFLGALGAVVYMALRAFIGQRYNLFTAIPYGPYIVAATLLMLLYGPMIQEMLMGYSIE